MYDFKSQQRRPTELIEKVMNDILQAIDGGLCVFLVLLDLSAAFDTVSHGILLHCLQSSFGVQDNALKQIASYLHQRTQSKSVGGSISERVTLEHGVPQGCVIVPDFFTDYMCQLASIIKSFSIVYYCYADDAQLYTAFTPGEDELLAVERLHSCFKALRTWMYQKKAETY